MAKEYIERDAVLEICEDAREEGFGDIRGVMHRVRMLNSADVVEVVRCKDCIYNANGCCTRSEEYDDTRYRPDYFCADGERRADE